MNNKEHGFLLKTVKKGRDKVKFSLSNGQSFFILVKNHPRDKTLATMEIDCPKDIIISTLNEDVCGNK